MIKNVLSIAGFDPSGGAGVLADIKTFAALRCYGVAAITALTAQNTQGVRALMPEPPEFLAAQIDALFADIEIAAVKIGMLANDRQCRDGRGKARGLSAGACRSRPRARCLAWRSPRRSGSRPGHPAPTRTARDPVTPNLAEAAQLAGAPELGLNRGDGSLAMQLHQSGVQKRSGQRRPFADARNHRCFYDGVGYQHFRAPRVATKNTHGTGCTLSSAIAAGLAKGWSSRRDRNRKGLCQPKPGSADELSVGRGPGPLQHFNGLW